MDIQIDGVGRQHIDLGCTPGGWLKKGTVDVQLWSGGGIARMHHMVHPGSDPVLLIKKVTCTGRVLLLHVLFNPKSEYLVKKTC